MCRWIDLLSFIMVGAVIDTDTYIGKVVIINTCASIDYDNAIDDYSHVTFGSDLVGSVKLGRHTWIGEGGGVVKNIEQSGIYVGVPVRKI